MAGDIRLGGLRTLWLALGLLFIALILYEMNFVVSALVFALAGIFVFAGTALHRSARLAGKKAKKLAGETIADIEKAEPSYPTQAQIGEGLKVLGQKAGDHAFLERNIWTMSSKDSNIRERLGRSSKNFISKFFEWFK